MAFSLSSLIHWGAKIGRALLDIPSLLRPTRQPKLIMTLLVKNEAELLAQNLRFHRAMGVDAFIITDNNSTDETPAIIQEFVEKGWVVESIKETDTGYQQKKWVDRMVLLARKHGADWVINADADEFWYTPSGSLKHGLDTTSANVLRAEVRNVLPEEDRPFTEWTSVVYPVPNPQDYDLSTYSIYGKDMVKVMHRTKGYLKISMGNHKVSMILPRRKNSDITIFHFNVRSRAQFIEKMENGGKELVANPSKRGGRHWRYFYELHQQGLLSAEYDRVVGYSVLDRLRADGFVRTDDRLAHFFSLLQH